MNLKSLSVLCIFAFSTVTVGTGQAADSLAIEQMAEIIINLDTKPADIEKQTLEDIIKDTASTTNEQTLASSLMNIDKKLSASDKPNVLKVMLSPSASETERDLARILLKFNGKVSEQTKQSLSQLITEQ